MDSPPVLSPELPSLTATAPRRVPAWRRVVMLLLLLGYVLGIGLASASSANATEPALPPTSAAMLLACMTELGFFAVVFGIAWLVGRTSPEEMFLRRWEGWKTWAWALLWSVAIRLLAMPVMLGFAGGLYLYKRIQGSDPIAMDDLRPKFENLISVEALNDPFYLVLTLTLLSFVVGGLREELWRAGVLASFQSLLPARWKNRRGAAAGVVLAGLVFGVAHLTQEGAGVVVISAVGLALGSIMVWRKSYWEAALAHGFFDATSLGALWAIQKFFPEELKQIVPG